MTIIYSEVLDDGPEHFNVLGQDATGYLYEGVTAAGKSLGYTFALDFQDGSREKMYLSDEGVRLFSLTAGLKTGSSGILSQLDAAAPEPNLFGVLIASFAAIWLAAHFRRRASASRGKSYMIE